MTTAEIKCQLWELLSAADKRKSKRSSRFGWLAFVVALPAGALIGGILAAALNFGDAAAIWSVILGGAAAPLGTAMHAVTRDDKHAAQLAVQFKSLFAEENGDFQTAVMLLRQFKTDSTVEKDLIKALGAGISFKGSPALTLKAKESFEDVSQNDIYSGLPPASSIKSMDDLFALLDKNPNFSGKFTKSSKKFDNGVYTSVEVISASSNNLTPGPTTPTNELLGALEDNAGGASAAPEPEKPNRPVAEPAPQYIPLDPYERPADGATEEPKPKRRRR